MERTLNKEQRDMLALERFFPHHLRDRAERLLFALSILFLSLAVLFNTLVGTRFGVFWPVFQGLFLSTFALLLMTILVEIYFHSLRIRLEKKHETSLATLLIIGMHDPKRKDLAKAFLHSAAGKEVMVRLGIADQVLKHFVSTKEHVDIDIPHKGFLPDLAGHIHDEDPYFRDFLERVHVSKELLVRSSEHFEKKHHRHLASRRLFHPLFQRKESASFNLEAATRKEIEELEHFYRIIITEQALQQIVAYFREDMLLYVSESERLAFLTEMIEYCLTAHKERFHGASVILPADARHFLIHKKAEVCN